jgi:hypothetical protein
MARHLKLLVSLAQCSDGHIALCLCGLQHHDLQTDTADQQHDGSTMVLASILASVLLLM